MKNNIKIIAGAILLGMAGPLISQQLPFGLIGVGCMILGLFLLIWGYIKNEYR